MIKDRYVTPFIVKDLKRKMVFIGGPRQVGKTTLATYIGKHHYHDSYAYYNRDRRTDRTILWHEKFPQSKKLLIFDEIHKARGWKNYIKGIYDAYKDRHHMIVTGSARLDIYRRGGDSLLGRYHYYRLHPFSLSEMLGVFPQLNISEELQFPEELKTGKSFRHLFDFGGFPEILLSHDREQLRRWQNERKERMVREDIRDVELVRDLSGIELLTEMLPSKVGSLLSLNSLREDLEINHKTITLWIEILERFYYHFRIYPYTASPIKSLRKPAKLYLWDWSEITDPAKRAENMVASHLLKSIHFLQDVLGYKAELFYLRDIEGREVDFIVTVDKKPWFAVEVKSSEEKTSHHLLYFAEKLKIPFVYQISLKKTPDILQHGVRHMSVETFLTGLL